MFWSCPSKCEKSPNRGQNLPGTLFNSTKEKGRLSIQTCLKWSILHQTSKNADLRSILVGSTFQSNLAKRLIFMQNVFEIMISCFGLLGQDEMALGLTKLTVSQMPPPLGQDEMALKLTKLTVIQTIVASCFPCHPKWLPPANFSLQTKYGSPRAIAYFSVKT